MSDYGEDFGNWAGGGRQPPPLYSIPPPDEFDNDPHYEQYATNGSHPDGDDVVSSWEPFDLGPYLDGTIIRPQPTLGMVRHDGIRFLYPGKEHAIIGETESGKSWFCLACALDEIQLGHTVLYIHFEEADPSDSVERLLALGASAEQLRERFKFVGPDTRITDHTRTQLLALTPRLVILDGVNEGMTLHGQDIDKTGGSAMFRRLMVKPFTAVGAAVLSCDHVVKNPEMRGRDAGGSGHKGNAIDGCRISLENVHTFGRGLKGKSRVFVTKDRPGFLRAKGEPVARLPGKTYMGDLVVDDTQEKSPELELRLWPPRKEAEDGVEVDPVVELGNRVWAVIDGLPDRVVATQRSLLAHLRAAGVEARDAEVYTTLDDLEVAGRVVPVLGKNRAKGYRCV